MPFHLFIKMDISHLDIVLSNILANTLKEQRKLLLSHLFCRFIFVHSIHQQPVPGNIYYLKIITTHADDERAFNITKIIRWMTNSHLLSM